MKRITTLFLLVMLVALVLSSTAFAGTHSGNGVTLSFPDDMKACEPVFNFSTTGVEENWTVAYNIFIETSPGVLAELDRGVVTGNLDLSFSPPSLAAGETKTYAIFIAVSDESGNPVVKLRGKWNVTCEKPPTGGQGCTPGYWRQDQHFDSWGPTGYHPEDGYDAVFGVDGSFDTLLQAVWAQGGGENALARHAVAALLNAAHPDVNYAYTVGEVLAGVQQAYASGDFEPFKDQLDEANNAGCPLN